MVADVAGVELVKLLLCAPWDALFWASSTWRVAIPYLRLVRLLYAPGEVQRFLTETGIGAGGADGNQRHFDPEPMIQFALEEGLAAERARTAARARPGAGLAANPGLNLGRNLGNEWCPRARFEAV